MMKRAVALAATTLATAALAWASTANALPGQCFSGPFGGFCDGQPWRDGSFQHCEQAGFGVFSYSNCFQACHDWATARAVPTDYDESTPC